MKFLLNLLIGDSTFAKRRAVTRLIMPMVLLILAYLAMDAVLMLQPAYQVLLVNLPYLLILLAIVLSQHFSQGRVGFAALIMGLAYWVIQNRLQTPLSEGTVLLEYVLLGAGLAVNLPLFAMLPERRMFSRRGLIYLVLLISQLGAAAFFVSLISAQPDSSLAGSVSNFLAIYFSRPFEQFILPLRLAALLTLSLGFIIALQFTRGHIADQVFFGSILAVGWTLVKFQQPFISTLLFSATAAVMLLNLFLSSHDMAFLDELTGLPGRRALNTELKHLGRCYTIAMLDVDHFKKFNDTWGHDTGDNVLRLVSSRMINLKGVGKAYRYGGEEFLVLFNGMSAQDCKSHLEMLREAIAEYKITIRDAKRRPSDKKGICMRGEKRPGKQVSVTISIGAAERNQHITTPNEVIKAADKALYKAKKAGRNCVVTARSLSN